MEWMKGSEVESWGKHRLRASRRKDCDPHTWKPKEGPVGWVLTSV